VLQRAKDEGLLVPNLWRLEIANVLIGAERRGRATRTTVDAALALLGALNPKIDTETDRRALVEIADLARDERLITYDASYLDLALRSSLPLATRDRELAGAARRRGVPLILKLDEGAA
jgi:predicted nucleic acid-binding protein